MNGLSDYDDRISFDRDRQLSDYVKFDRVGAEGFALEFCNSRVLIRSMWKSIRMVTCSLVIK